MLGLQLGYGQHTGHAVNPVMQLPDGTFSPHWRYLGAYYLNGLNMFIRLIVPKIASAVFMLPMLVLHLFGQKSCDRPGDAWHQGPRRFPNGNDPLLHWSGCWRLSRS